MPREITEQKLQQALARRQKRRIITADRVLSAVLLPIYYREGQYYILFTKRTQQVSEHKGQISFPGGVYQPEDATLLATALRECAEEIGVKARDVEVLGELDDAITTTSSYVISPYVGLIPWPYQFQVNAAEIEQIITAPLSALLNSRCRRQQTETLDGKAMASYVYHYQGEIIWGATARILNQFLDIFRRVNR